MGYFIDPKSDSFFKTELAKTAFSDNIYESLPLDYYLPFITSTHKMLQAYKNIHAKFYQAHDAFLMHYKPYHLVFQSLKKSNEKAQLWRLIVEKTLKNKKFLDLNEVTAGSSELSIVAAVKFLESILGRGDVEEMQRRLEKRQQSLDQLEREVFNNTVIGEAIENAMSAVKEYKEAREVAEEAVTVIAGGHGGTGFTKEALSVVRFLEKPDEFRRRVALLRYAKVFFTRFLTAVPTSLVHQQIVSVYGGVNGVARMTSEKQLSDILPSELVLTQLGEAGRALLAVKVAQRQLMVYQRGASVKPVVFVDKSGSMAESYERSYSTWEGIPKISVASGLALALYRKLNADVYLFDTEIEKVNPAKVIEVLLRIDADGGTNIDPVLEEIIRLGKTEHTYIIVSDGITEASPSVLEEFKESGLAKRTKLILVPPSEGEYSWVKLLREHGNVWYARDVAEFEQAVKRVLSP